MQLATACLIGRATCPDGARVVAKMTHQKCEICVGWKRNRTSPMPLVFCTITSTVFAEQSLTWTRLERCKKLTRTISPVSVFVFLAQVLISVLKQKCCISVWWELEAERSRNPSQRRSLLTRKKKEVFAFLSREQVLDKEKLQKCLNLIENEDLSGCLSL